MDENFRRAFNAVLRYEIRQGLRSRAWWLLLLNFGLPILLTSASPLDPWVPLTRRVFVPIMLALAFLIVAPFVYLLIFEREDTPWAYDIFWVRLPHTGGALLAKAVASIVLVFLAAAPVLAWILVVALFYHGWDGLQSWGQALLIFLPPIFVYLALVLVAMLLLPYRFGIRVLSLFLMLALLFLQDQVSLLHLWSPLTKIYLSLVTGIHPFSRLLIWHRLFWVLLTMGITLWALAQLNWRARRPIGIYERRWGRNMQWLGVFLILVALIPAFFFHREKAQRFYEVAPNNIQTSPAWQRNKDDPCPQAYQVNVTFDLSRLQVQGHAMWQGTHATPKLQAGLRGTLIREGQRTRMDYQGSPRWPRQVIWCPECSQDLTLLAQRSLQPYLLGWYFVEGHLFLLMTGPWHPFPGCPVERLQVGLDHIPCEACIAVTGTPVQHPGEKAWEFIWEKPPAQGPLLIMATTYQGIERKGRHLLLPKRMFSSRVQMELATPYWTTLEHMEEWGLLAEEEARTLAVVDHLTYPRWGQGGLVLVPVERIAAKKGGLDYQRSVALTLLMGWWCQGAESCVVQFADVLSEWRNQQNLLLPDISLEDPDQLAQQLNLQEQNTSLKEISVLPSLFLYAAYRLQDPISTYHPLTMDFSGLLAYPFLIKRSPVVLDSLDALYRQDPSQFWHILRIYRDTYGIMDISLAAFVQWVENDLGVRLPEPDPASPQR